VVDLVVPLWAACYEFVNLVRFAILQFCNFALLMNCQLRRAFVFRVANAGFAASSQVGEYPLLKGSFVCSNCLVEVMEVLSGYCTSRECCLCWPKICALALLRSEFKNWIYALLQRFANKPSCLNSSKDSSRAKRTVVVETWISISAKASFRRNPSPAKVIPNSLKQNENKQTKTDNRVTQISSGILQGSAKNQWVRY